MQVDAKLGETFAFVSHIGEQCFICELTNHSEERTGGFRTTFLTDSGK